MRETSAVHPAGRQSALALCLVFAGLAHVALIAPPAFAGGGSPAREAFFRYCSACHGITGQGDGEVAASLRTRPADLTRLAEKNGGTFPYEQVRETIDGRQRVAAHGSSDMPVWGQIFVKERTYEDPEEHARSQISLIVSYLASIQTVQPGSTVPVATPD